MDDFRGKVAVVTGGASGIGLATARALAAEGMHIVIADIEDEALAAAAAELATKGSKVVGIRTDVGDLGSVEALAERAFAEFGAVHLLFNNAGVVVAGPIQAMTHQDWEWVMRVNLWGVIHGVEAFVPRMIEQSQGGHIVNTASFAGLVPNTGLGVYCVTKYGVVALSECLYRDLSSEGIGVSVLCPMGVATRIGQSQRNRPQEMGKGQPLLNSLDPADTAGAGVITPDEVARHVIESVKKGELYIVTHPESRDSIRRRFERIDRVFES